MDSRSDGAEPWSGWEDILIEGNEGEFILASDLIAPPMSGLRCPHRPELTFGPIGQYHCPICGMMVLAGFGHPLVNNYEDRYEYAELAMYLHLQEVERLKKAGILQCGT